ncbi:SRPBCC family protein [Paucisalibacillus sp. EB02]|uniref:SRPBCC family protein n=1 Tax=Paucisalibacillus sp. EB02 TaxID=1347087 RepID=UPI0005AA9F60|nr:SRPBCC family protein [Paucisalibacillus sp. EB02]
MLANIKKESNEYVVTYVRLLDHPLKDVWEMITYNDKLSLWFNELHVVKLGLDGYLRFDMGDGTYERMDITDFEENAVLEYTWGEDLVRFELTDLGTSTKLVLIEKVSKLTDHTPKDLAGWHVCLDVIAAILDKIEVENRIDNWKYWFEEYREQLKSVK